MNGDLIFFSSLKASEYLKHMWSPWRWLGYIIIIVQIFVQTVYITISVELCSVHLTNGFLRFEVILYMFTVVVVLRNILAECANELIWRNNPKMTEIVKLYLPLWCKQQSMTTFCLKAATCLDPARTHVHRKVYWAECQKRLTTSILSYRYTGYCPRLRFKCGRTYGADTDKLTRVSITGNHGRSWQVYKESLRKQPSGYIHAHRIYFLSEWEFSLFLQLHTKNEKLFPTRADDPTTIIRQLPSPNGDNKLTANMVTGYTGKKMTISGMNQLYSTLFQFFFFLILTPLFAYICTGYVPIHSPGFIFGSRYKESTEEAVSKFLDTNRKQRADQDDLQRTASSSQRLRKRCDFQDPKTYPDLNPMYQKHYQISKYGGRMRCLNSWR